MLARPMFCSPLRFLAVFCRQFPIAKADSLFCQSSFFGQNSVLIALRFDDSFEFLTSRVFGDLALSPTPRSCVTSEGGSWHARKVPRRQLGLVALHAKSKSFSLFFFRMCVCVSRLLSTTHPKSCAQSREDKAEAPGTDSSEASSSSSSSPCLPSPLVRPRGTRRCSRWRWR